MQHFVLSLAELPEVYRDPPLNPDKVSLDGIRYRCVLTAPHSSVMTTDTPRVLPCRTVRVTSKDVKYR